MELLANLDEEILYDVLDDFMGSVDVREVPEAATPPPQQQQQQPPSAAADTTLLRNDKDANFYGQRHDHELVLINKQVQGTPRAAHLQPPPPPPPPLIYSTTYTPSRSPVC